MKPPALKTVNTLLFSIRSSLATVLTEVAYISRRFSDDVMDPTFATLWKNKCMLVRIPGCLRTACVMTTPAANIWTTWPEDWFVDVTVMHDDLMTWKQFPHCWPLVIGIPDSKTHGANRGPIWGRQDPGGPHVGPMNFAIRESIGFPSPKVSNSELACFLFYQSVERTV